MKRRIFLASGLAVGIAGCATDTEPDCHCPNGDENGNDRNGDDPNGDHDIPIDHGPHTYTLEPDETVSGTFTFNGEGFKRARIMTDNDTDVIEL